MAKAKVEKKITGIAMELPGCPVCLDTMSAPIFQCQSGHSLCHSCTKLLCPPNCPICREPMTQMRNWKLEEIIDKAKVPCPNQSLGCIYTMPSKDIDNHIKECIFREMVCLLGSVFGKCSWKGNVKEMLNHFKERHPQNCNINIDTDVELNNISTKEDERFLYLVPQGNLLFVVTMKIDVLQKVAFWVVQLIGSKQIAQQHLYEIHITSKQDNRRKIIFIDHCFNDAISADGVYNLGKCAILPLSMFSNFISNKKCSFKFLIKRVSAGPKTKFDKSENQHVNKQQLNKANNKAFKPKGPQNHPRHKSPGPNRPQ